MDDDAGLVASAAAGDRDALGAIYDRHADGIHDFCRSVLRDEHSAADVTQDVFVMAAQKLGDLRDPTRLRAWLFAIARHACYRRFESRRRVHPVENVESAGEAPSAEESAVGAVLDDEAQRIVWAAADGLEPRDRAVLDLHVRQDLVGQDLADALGVSEGNAAVLLHRVKARFERAVGAMLVARPPIECAELRNLLIGWDGRFTPQIRKSVARHVDGCDECEHRRRIGVAPLATFAAVPVLPAPAAIRDRVIATSAGAETAPPSSGWRGEFPPADGRPREPRLVGAGALVALLLLLVVALVVRDDGRGSRVETATDADTEEAPASSTTTAVSPTLLPPTSAAGPTVPGDPGAPSTTGVGDLDGSTLDATTMPAGGSAPSTGSADPPADSQAPWIGSFVANPSAFHEDGTAGCTDTTASISVAAADASGIDGVVLQWSVGGQSGAKSMVVQVGTWRATLGPFGDGTVPFATSESVVLRVVATDGAGNVAYLTGSVTLHDCSFA